MTPKQKIQRQAILTAAFHDHEKGLNARAFFKVSNHALGEDLVQSTFLKTWAYLVKGGKIVVMKAFLHHILNNLIVDEYRKNKPTSLDVMMDQGFEPKNTEEKNMADVLDGKGALLLILRLPVKYQKVLRMRYVQDLTLKEMSLITGTSQNSIAVKIHRGLEKLKLLHDPI